MPTKPSLSFKVLFLTSITFLSFPASVPAQERYLPAIVAQGATLELLSGEFSFTEGPASDKEGNIYFTDQPNNRIMKWTVEGKMETFLQPCGRSNGLFFDNDGNLWACADENNELWKISPSKEITKSTNQYQGARLNGPNDLWIAPNGKIYFTDPYFKRTWWNHTGIPQEKHRVYMYDPITGIITGLVDDLAQPNGIVGTPDGKTLYVADNNGNQTWSFQINNDGTLRNKRLFCAMSSDGITIDSEGNLYLTGNGVTIFNKGGEKIGNIPVPESWTANVCFGGKERNYLYITASKGLYRIKMEVKGTY